MKTLHCAIKQEYLDMIISGAKKVEYRDMSPYWVGKICDVPSGKDIDTYRTDIISGKIEPKFKPYTHITFHCNQTTLTLPITGIRTYKGHKLFAIGLDNTALTKQKE